MPTLLRGNSTIRLVRRAPKADRWQVYDALPAPIRAALQEARAMSAHSGLVPCCAAAANFAVLPKSMLSTTRCFGSSLRTSGKSPRRPGNHRVTVGVNRCRHHTSWPKRQCKPAVAGLRHEPAAAPGSCRQEPPPREGWRRHLCSRSRRSRSIRCGHGRGGRDPRQRNSHHGHRRDNPFRPSDAAAGRARMNAITTAHRIRLSKVLGMIRSPFDKSC